MGKRVTSILLQAGAWIILFAVWYQLAKLYMQDHMLALRVTAYQVSSLLLAFYVVYLCVNPKKFYNRSRSELMLLILQIVFICGTGLTIVSWFVAKPLVRPNDLKVFWQWQDLVFNKYFIALGGALAGLGFKLYMDWSQMKHNFDILEKEKLRTELDYLRAQINPHFIFNSLNTVYFQIDRQNKEARESLHTFSDLLRYQLYECNEEKIPIEKEVAYLRNYVQFQRLRKGKHYEISFESESDVRDFEISPLLLIPILENAFKHLSAYTEKVNVVNILLRKQGNKFILDCLNTKEDVTVDTSKEHSGIGLANVRRRLDLLYPGRYSLEIKNEPETYYLVLCLEI